MKITENLEKRIYSQNGEDGITLELLDIIGHTDNKYFVEIGVETGIECNTKILKDLHFNGIMIDGNYSNEQINLYKEFVTAENINYIFEKYNVPSKFDVLSIDVDSNDLFLFQALNDNYQPSIVIIEYCGYFPPPLSVCNEYIPNKIWKGNPLIGASLSALNKIANIKGYTLVYCEKEGINAFFVRNELIPKLKIQFPEHLFGNVEELFVKRRIVDWSFFDSDGTRNKFIEI